MILCLHVQFSYYLLVFIQLRGWAFASSFGSHPRKFANFILKNAYAQGLAPGGMGTAGLMDNTCIFPTVNKQGRPACERASK